MIRMCLLQATPRIIFAPFVLVLVTMIISLSGCERQRPRVAVGQVMPRTELHDMNGAKVVIPDDMKGDVVVVRFWADCCSYNIYEMEAVHIIQARYGDKGFSVLTVYSGNSKETARGFIDELKIPYPVLLDVGGEVAGRFEISRLPTTFILDRDGVIREMIIGDTERKTWRDRYEGVIAALLK